MKIVAHIPATAKTPQGRFFDIGILRTIAEQNNCPLNELINMIKASPFKDLEEEDVVALINENLKHKPV